MPKLKLFFILSSFFGNSFCVDNLPQGSKCRSCLDQLEVKCPVVRQDIHSIKDLKILNLLANTGLVLKPGELKKCEPLSCVLDCVDNGPGTGGVVILDDLTALTVIAAVDFTPKE